MTVCFGALGFVLLFLFHPALGIPNLPNIIDDLDAYGIRGQYALGINVHANYCQEGARLDQNVLPLDNAENVNNNLNLPEKIYRDYHLIAAKPKRIGTSKNNFHSEYRLLIRSNTPELAGSDPLMRTLLDSDPQGCTVFFTVNSPCVQTCSTPNRCHSIIPALEMFQSRPNDRKAFVFRQVWHHDVDSAQWERNIRVINDLIPVYRCDATGCTRCVDNNNRVHPACLRN